MIRRGTLFSPFSAAPRGLIVAIDTSEMQAIDTPEMQASAQRCSKKCSQDVHWSHLPADLLLELIDRFLDGSATIAMVLTHVCRDWRETILGDRWILEKLKYRRLTFQGALADTNNTNNVNNTNNTNNANNANDVLPAIFSKSLLHGNPYAHVARAKFLVASASKKSHPLAAKHWRVASKKGHPLALYHVGLQSYEAFDPEDAYLHLKRACKQLMSPVSAGDENDNLFLMTHDERQMCLRQASLILGIIIVDNDLEFEDFGFDKDYSGAITWLGIARDRGCADASRIIASLHRNGNY